MSTETTGVGDGPAGARPLVAVARFEGRNRVRMTAVLTVLFSLFGALYLWIGPDLIAGEAIQQMLDSLPEIINELFGFESLQSLEGLLASEFYTLGWIVGLAGYLAYTAAGTVAGDLREQRMDTLLAGPVARQSVLLGKYLALLVPILVLNVAVPGALYVGSIAVGTPLPLGGLVIVHALSIPYLLFWGGVGLFLGVTVRGGRRAGRAALGLVFGAWLFESVVSTTDYAWLGGLSPARYFDPPAVLVQGTYDLVGAGVLLVGTAALVAGSHLWFRRFDI